MIDSVVVGAAVAREEHRRAEPSPCSQAAVSARAVADCAMRTAQQRAELSRALPVLPTAYALPWDTKTAMFSSPSPRARAFGGLQSPRSLHSARAWDPGKGRRLPPLELPSAFGIQTDSRRGSSAVSIVGGRAPRFGPAEDSRGRVPTYTPSPLAYRAVPACGVQPLSSRQSAMQVSMNHSHDRWHDSEMLLRCTATPGPAYYFPKS